MVNGPADTPGPEKVAERLRAAAARAPREAWPCRPDWPTRRWTPGRRRLRSSTPADVPVNRELDRSGPVGGRPLDPQGPVREPLPLRTVLIAVPVGRQRDHLSVTVILHRLTGERLPLIHGHVVFEVEVFLVGLDRFRFPSRNRRVSALP